MTGWRMALRVGNQGPSMWEECWKRGVVAITSHFLVRTNLLTYPAFEPRAKWRKLHPTQKSSLGHVAYDMKGGDAIYVREGKSIIAQGKVKGRRGAAAYRFDSTFRLVDPNGTPWAHQVPVAWDPNFEEMPNKLGQDQVTVKALTPKQVKHLKSEITANRKRRTTEAHEREKDRAIRLAEDKYFRESRSHLKIIIPRHNRLSNAFCTWLKQEFGITANRKSAGLIFVSVGSGKGSWSN
jgi:hypothetical protein